MKAVVTLVLAVAVFALPLGASAQYYGGGYAPAYSQACAPPAPVCAPAPVCPPQNCYEQTCFSPLAPVGAVIGGVGSLITGVGNAIGGLFTSCSGPCY
jgi:hypothetical protein